MDNTKRAFFATHNKLTNAQMIKLKHNLPEVDFKVTTYAN